MRAVRTALRLADHLPIPAFLALSAVCALHIRASDALVLRSSRVWGEDGVYKVHRSSAVARPKEVTIAVSVFLPAQPGQTGEELQLWTLDAREQVSRRRMAPPMGHPIERAGSQQVRE